ncbi:MAG TPA: hypothetical protein VKE93_11370 [Candidatus Angelobacter sp.]|nr:hypothetical protein [Candidatus Angelobacter sp.]
MKDNLTCTLAPNLRSRLMIATALFLAMELPALAQPNLTQTSAPESRTAGPDKPATSPQPAIRQEQALYLVRSTLLTLNDANHSGNYTVLRDLAAPDFQARNSSADLAQSFADLRRRNFDLFAAALIAPQFTAEPALDGSGKLRMAGFFPTRPLRINFDLKFQNVNGQWRLFAVAVATPEAPAIQSQLNRPTVPRHSAGPFYGYRILSGIAGWRW